MSTSILFSRQPRVVSVCVAGMLVLAIAMGIGRFAFTPILPLMIRAGQIDVAAGGWLAAANYIGYLLGALTAARIPLSPQRIGLLSLILIVLTTAAMGATSSEPLWLVMRAVAGAASAWALISTSVWCLAWLARLGQPAGAGILYAGVGAGIASAGLYCWQAGSAGVEPNQLWWRLAEMALAASVIVVVLMPHRSADDRVERDALAKRPPSLPSRRSVPAEVAAPTDARAGSTMVPWGLVICYGALGFGYILPATFLPVLARAVVDDPAVFGAAWPVFGTAAMLSTLFAGLLLNRLSRTQVLAGSHLLMALGCVLPLVHLSAWTVLAASLLIGGTFMVATMAGMQQARALASGDPTRALSRMTAAFAIGQIAGPVLSSLLSGRSQDFRGLFIALAVAAVALVASAVALAWQGRRSRLPRSV